VRRGNDRGKRHLTVESRSVLRKFYILYIQSVHYLHPLSSLVCPSLGDGPSTPFSGSPLVVIPPLILRVLGNGKNPPSPAIPFDPALSCTNLSPHLTLNRPAFIRRKFFGLIFRVQAIQLFILVLHIVHLVAVSRVLSMSSVRSGRARFSRVLSPTRKLDFSIISIHPTTFLYLITHSLTETPHSDLNTRPIMYKGKLLT